MSLLRIQSWMLDGGTVPCCQCLYCFLSQAYDYDLFLLPTCAFNDRLLVIIILTCQQPLWKELA